MPLRLDTANTAICCDVLNEHGTTVVVVERRCEARWAMRYSKAGELARCRHGACDVHTTEATFGDKHYEVLCSCCFVRMLNRSRLRG